MYSGAILRCRYRLQTEQVTFKSEIYILDTGQVHAHCHQVMSCFGHFVIFSKLDLHWKKC